MIPIAIILAAALIVGLAAFWKEIVAWIKKAVEKLKAALGIIVKGTKTFTMKTREGLKNRAKHYNENDITGEWEETVVSTIVDESEVPPEILKKVRIQVIDIEVETTEELRLAINA